MVIFGFMDCLRFDKRGIKKEGQERKRKVCVCVCVCSNGLAEQSDNEGEKKRT